MAPVDDAKKALGELFIIGFNGLQLEDDTAAFISQAKIGGVILFAPNYESPTQVATLCNQVQECREDLPLWISVDHEGGRVQRFKKGFTRIPDAQLMAKIESTKQIFEITEMIAKELKAVGINVNFCPVADINSNPKNPVIGPRAYGDNEEQVSRLVTAVVRGHLIAGVQPCVKHFPGHGDTNTDSHFALPRVDTPLNLLQEREFRPFVKAFKSRCNMVMTAHVLSTQLDTEYPATLSKKILQDVLRKELRFTKLIISDDLEMKAITDHYGAEESPRLAVDAGCDLLIYRSESAARHAYEALIHSLEQGTLAPETVLLAAARSREVKKEFHAPYEPVKTAEVSQKVGTPANQALIDQVPKS